jgi:RNA polymerase sigma-70 factor (ECF subfamily)
MAAFRGIRKFREESSLPTWLYRITLNASRELYRNRKARTRALERYRRGAEDEAGTVSEEDDSELRPLVRKFLEELTERQRGMMDLVDLQGYTPAEAAEMLGLNPNTARVHLLRARRHMRASLLARKPHVLEDLR